MLRLVALAVKQNVKGQDVAARYGGEEFAVILPNTALRAALTVADHIRRAVMTKELMKRSTGEHLGRVTVSIGVAALQKGETAQSLIERADSCLYAAKRVRPQPRDVRDRPGGRPSAPTQGRLSGAPLDGFARRDRGRSARGISWFGSRALTYLCNATSPANARSCADAPTRLNHCVYVRTHRPDSARIRIGNFGGRR